ncbi:MAG: GNAT family N-acetyltransferase [Paracoccaceae bacterium]
MTPKALANIHKAAFPKSAWTAESFAQLLKNPTTQVLTRPNAFLIACVIPPEAEILTLAVAPEVRRTGLAAHMIEELKSQHTHIFLEVRADNRAAIQLYERSGFTLTGRRAGYYRATGQPPIDALLMAWS